MNLEKFKILTYRLCQNSLVKNTLWMLLSQGIRLVLQAIYFIIIARTLGTEQYGVFVGATALVAIVGPLASLGNGNLLIKNVSRNKSLFREYWGNSLFMIFVFGFILIVFILII